jgi:putative membrane protein
MSNIDRQREHQANERTFLAWLRTSIALIGFGFAIARFGLFLRQLETTVILLSVWRYNQVFWQIEQGNYKPSRLMVWFTAGVVVLLGILSIPFLLWREYSTPNTPSSPSSRTERHPEKLLSLPPTLKRQTKL